MGALGDERAASSAIQVAILAVEAYAAFVGGDAGIGTITVVDPDPDEVRVAVTRARGTEHASGHPNR